MEPAIIIIIVVMVCIFVVLGLLCRGTRTSSGSEVDLGVCVDCGGGTCDGGGGDGGGGDGGGGDGCGG